MRSRIGVGILALGFVSSCGGRALDMDGGFHEGGATGITGVGNRGIGGGGAGGAATGGQSGAIIGSGGASGRGGTVGTAGVAGSTGRGGIGGTTGFGGGSGTGGISGRGGIGGTGGTGGTTGRGGSAGTGGTGGSGGTGGTGGSGGTGGTGGSGGTGGTGGSGGIGGTGGSSGTGGTAGRGGAGGTGGSGAFGGEFGTAGRGGSIGTGGSAGTGGIGGIGGRGGNAGGGAGGGGTGGTVCLTCRSTILPISGRDLVYSAARNELYVSVAGDADAYANTIVVVDPSASSVVSTIPVGSNPGALALSDDGSTLWVGIDGAHAIRKVTMTSTPPTVGPLTRLTHASPPTYFDAASMAVLRGAPLSVAVAFSVGSYQYYASDVRVYDDGAPRPVSVNGLAASSLTTGPPGYVFGNLSSPSYFFVYAVSPSGISQTINYNLFFNYTTNIVYSADRVYSGSGDVIDVTNPATPTRVGGFGRTGPVAMRDLQSVLMLTTGQNTFPFTPRADVRVFSTSSLSELADVQLRDSVAPTGSTTYKDLVYAGGDAVAFLRSDYVGYANPSRLAIVHDPAFGMPIGGSGGTGGMGGTGGAAGAGGTGGTAGMGGTGGAPDPCPGCTFATAQAYGLRFAHDASRNLLYVSAGFQAALHPSTIVTVDEATAAVTSFVPVGNDPQPLALSDDGSALWVGLGDHRVRRMTPGTTPVPGPAYALPMLLTTGELPVPGSIAVLPGTASSIAVAVYGASLGGQGVLILDDGQPRANYIQPPEIPASWVINGPPGYLLGIGASNNLVVFRLGSVGATLESYGGLVSSYSIGLDYSGGFAYAGDGSVIDLLNPDAPLPAGRFAFTNCLLTVRSSSRAFMLCPNPNGRGPILRVLDTGNFVQVGAVTLPDSLSSQTWTQFSYIGGDALALLAYDFPLQIMHAPIIGSPP